MQLCKHISQRNSFGDSSIMNYCAEVYLSAAEKIYLILNVRGCRENCQHTGLAPRRTGHGKKLKGHLL